MHVKLPTLIKAVHIASLALASTCCSLAAASLSPGFLRTEYLENPIGTDETKPRFTWLAESSARGEKQTAYQILVASDPKQLGKNHGDLWDSGKVSSDESVNVPYAGKPLASRQVCYWKLKVWDKDGKASEWSTNATWSMGLLKPEDWQAQYISFRDFTPVYKKADPLFLVPAYQYRKEFSAKKAIRRATIYSTALGIYELHLNGHRVGDAFFTPGWSDYHQRAYYNTYDVTLLIKTGTNALGAWVSDGWYAGYIGFGLLTGMGTEKIGRNTYGKTAAWMGQLEIEYADGSRDIIITDNSWKVTSAGPIQQADLLMGELYDARKEMPHWAEAGFDDSKWQQAIRAEENGSAKATFYEFQNPAPGEKLEVKGHPVDLAFKRPPRLDAYPAPPVRRVQEIKPLSITSRTNGSYIFNLGQNFAGAIRLKVKGPAGTQVKIRHGEMLHPDGRLMTENLRDARATDFYILRGDPEGEVYIPRFTYHGFQYVELTGYPGKPDLDSVTGIVLQSDTPLASGFECSDPMCNRLFKNIVWTQRANFLELPTDCPQRDERFGWTGDAQIYVRTATYNADVAAFYTKWLRELMESQRPSGTFPGYAPFPFQHGLDFGTAWCDAGVICPWTIYKAYGDTRILERCWEPMVKFINWRKSESTNFLGVAHGNDWGDWLALNEKTPLDYVDTIYFAYSTKLMVEIAQALGKKKEADEYTELFENIRTAFNKKYVKPDGSLVVDTQTAYAQALATHLLPEGLREKTAARLGQKIANLDYLMGTGFLGTKVLLPALSSFGQHDLATRLFQSHKYPSWGYEIEQGATTIWERWNSYTKEDGFGGGQNAAMNSFSHYSFGAVCEWMFSTLVGIDSDGAGFKKILIHPMPPSPKSNPDHEPINWVRAHYDSIRGRIESSWKREGDEFKLDLTIPPNTTAIVFLPANDRTTIKEGGQGLEDAARARAKGVRLLHVRDELEDAKGVKFFRARDDVTALAVESGQYHFACKVAP